MKLSEYTLNQLIKPLNGDNLKSPYLSGPDLITLFGAVGEKDVYLSEGFTQGMSRGSYVISKLKKINDTPKLRRILETVFHRNHFQRKPDLDLDEAVQEVNALIREEGYELVEVDGKYKVSSKEMYEEITLPEVHFEDNLAKIKEEVQKAKYLIWVAVSWFTNKQLYDLLVQKREEGLSVQVIINDDATNNNSGLDFKKGFHTIKLPPQGYFNTIIMHHKFCIIDLKVVIHGSFNWTNNASRNKETIEIQLSREISERFADEFMKLKQTLVVTK